MSEKRGKELTAAVCPDQFLPRAQTLFRGRAFLLLLTFSAALFLLNLIRVLRAEQFVVATADRLIGCAIMLCVSLTDIATLLPLRLHTDAHSLRTRQIARRILLILLSIAAVPCAIFGGILTFFAFSSSMDSYVQGQPPLCPPLGLLSLLIMLVLLVSTVIYYDTLNGFYKNLCSLSSGRAIKRPYAHSARYLSLFVNLPMPFLPYLLNAFLIPQVPNTQIKFPGLAESFPIVPAPDALDILCILLSLAIAAFTFFFFNQADAIERDYLPAKINVVFHRKDNL